MTRRQSLRTPLVMLWLCLALLTTSAGVTSQPSLPSSSDEAESHVTPLLETVLSDESGEASEFRARNGSLEREASSQDRQDDAVDFDGSPPDTTTEPIGQEDSLHLEDSSNLEIDDAAIVPTTSKMFLHEYDADEQDDGENTPSSQTLIGGDLDTFDVPDSSLRSESTLRPSSTWNHTETLEVSVETVDSPQSNTNGSLDIRYETAALNNSDLRDGSANHTILSNNQSESLATEPCLDNTTSCNSTDISHNADGRESLVNDNAITPDDIPQGDAPATDNSDPFDESGFIDDTQLEDEFLRIMNAHGTNWLLDPNATVDHTPTGPKPMNDAPSEPRNGGADLEDNEEDTEDASPKPTDDDKSVLQDPTEDVLDVLRESTNPEENVPRGQSDDTDGTPSITHQEGGSEESHGVDNTTEEVEQHGQENSQMQVPPSTGARTIQSADDAFMSTGHGGDATHDRAENTDNTNETRTHEHVQESSEEGTIQGDAPASVASGPSELRRLGYRFDARPDPEEAAAGDALLAAAGDGVLGDGATGDDGAGGPPPAGASLAFVFDSTGSMHDDLQQVMTGTQAILRTMLEDEHKPIHNYVLVPFHDPKVGPLTVTTNHTQFNNSLKAISVHLGGDCPEMALGGIKMALEASLPRSFIYVFTDASAKDIDLLQDVVSLVQRKKSQVVFVLTGDCGDRKNVRYQVYEKIADTSSGQVFHLNKTEVDEVLEFVRLSLQSRRVNLLSVTRQAGAREEHSLLVDSSLDEITVAVAGKNAQLDVEDPRGRAVAQPRLQPVLSLRDVKVVKVERPDPGRWKVHTASDSTHSVRSTGTSHMDIRFGFSVAPVANMHQTFHRPLKGTPNHILIQATEYRDLHNLTSLRLVNLNGSTIYELPLTPVDPVDLKGAYTGSPFLPPVDIFFVEVTGIGSDGNPLKRMTPTAISAQKPDVPIVTTKPRLAIPVGQTGTITCYVESLIPFSVLWFKDGALARERTSYKQTTDVFLQLSNMTEALEGTYTCHASNEEGSTAKQTKVRVTGPPPVVTMKERIVTTPGANIELLCEVESVLNYTVSWFRYSGRRRDFRKGKPWPLRMNSHMRLEIPNKLVISAIKPDDEGWYSCLVQSRGGKKEGNTYLQVRDPVHVVVYPTRLNFQQGEEISISCRASGTPVPKLEWRKNGNVLEDEDEDGRISIVRKLGEADILVTDADHSDEGRYECYADNGIDNSNQETEVEYVEQPTASAIESNKKVAFGETVNLQCEKSGFPVPSLKWYKDGEEVIFNSDKILEDDILKILNAKDEDAGLYKCEASNTIGTNEDTIHLEVGTAPQMIQSPTDTTVDINQNISLPCIATGHPSPIVSWQRKYQESLPDDRYSISSTGTLHIFGAQVEDEGMYICRVENKFGAIEREAKLKITGIEKPVIDRADDNGRVAEKSLGANIELPCQILMGNPPPERVWYKDGMEVDQQVIAEDSIALYDNGSLVVPYITHKHAGTYECVVRNAGGSVSKETVLRVIEAPHFTNKASHEQHALVGADIQLLCDVQGEPKPLVTWEKDGLLLTPTHRIKKEEDDSITIRAATLGDKGIFTCIAINSAGTARRSTFLSMQSPPKISSGPQDLHAVEGQLLTIKCEVSAEPSPHFIWWKNGKLLNSSIQDVQYLQQNSSIRFVATIHAQGTYTCVATNPAGRASKDTQVLVMVPPNIYPPYEEQIAAAIGNNVTLDCQVFGSPPPKVYWQKDGEYLNDDSEGIQIGEDGTLTILNITSESGGIYICDAENDVGISQKLFYFSVNVPPKVLEATPNKVQLMEGEDFYLPCTASGYPLPEVRWHKDGRDVVTLDADDMTVQDDGTLMLHSVHQEHSGLYVCVAENKHGSDHRNYIVNVLIPPSMIQAEASELEVIEGAPLVIACPAMDAVPPPQIEWLKDGRRIDPLSIRLSLVDNGRALKILEAHPSDRGTYWCVASNLAGQSSASFNVDVLTAPSFSDNGNNAQQLDNQRFEVTIGNSVTFRCAVNGHPIPRVSWKKNNHPITIHTAPGVVLSGDKQILHIPNTQQHDAGHYQCSVMNKVGSSNRDFKLIVIKPPSLVGPNEKHLKLISGSNVLLHCPFTGLPDPSISWTKDGMESHIIEMSNVVISSDQKLLEISSAKPADSGIYVCESHNVAGHAQKLFNVSVLDPPNILQESTLEEVTVSEGETVSLHCWVQGTPYPQIMWMHNGHMLPHQHNQERHTESATKEELWLKNVQSSQAGQYTCLASNEVGVAEKRFHLHVMVAPKLMHEMSDNDVNDINAPEHHEKIKGMPFTLHCPVEGKPLPEVHWIKDSQPLAPNVIGSGPTLQINDSRLHHSGNYTCVAHNEAGTATKTFQVTIQDPPSIKVNNTNFKIRAGDKLTLHCEVSGFPLPEVIWLKGAVSITPAQWPHASFMNNNFTLVVPDVRIKNAGQYSCLAMNKVGTAEHNFNVEVLQAPHLSESLPENSTHKVKLNRRLVLKCLFEGFPIPNISWYKDENVLYNNIDEGSIHISSDQRQLHILHARIEDSGTYKCRAENVAGLRELLFVVDVQTMAQWTDWGPWSECSSSCGPGEQVRKRTCGDPELEDPFAQIECSGAAEEWQNCNMAECQVNGGWSEWSSWTSCSISCGRGTRRRYRKCNNPVPMYGGAICLGSDAQQEYCHQLPCPMDGQWSDWTPWTDCSVTCDNGVQHRTRQCNNPPPSYGGSNCTGKALEVINCNSHECPQDGQWSNWSKWTACSTSCGPGNKQRTRECNNPQPKYGGNECRGENLQISHCTIRSCDNMPLVAALRVKGKLNGENLTDSIIAANITDDGHKRTVQASVNDILKQQAGWFPYLTFMLSPISWNTAMEKDEANNGYSLTQGHFKQESMVEFGSGEGLMLKHIGHGIDDSGVLQVEIEVNGQVPIIEQTAHVVINPFEEDYVQTSPNSLFASSASSLNVNGVKLPYSWNNTVSYDSLQGTMPYLVEKLSAEEIGVKYNPRSQEMTSVMSTAIGKKYTRDTCPDGFVLDTQHMHCRDINECSDKRTNRCHVTQICENLFGTYRCSCERGFRSSAIGKRCVDVNECLQTPSPCSHRCRNTRGGFKCQCPPGYILLDNGRTCSEAQYWDYPDENEEINYVRPIPRSGTGRRWRPNRVLPWTATEQQFSCPSGYAVENGVCHDIDECRGVNVCTVNETCLNVKGSFRCLETPCPEKYERNSETGYCLKFCDESPCEDGARLTQTITYMVVTPEDEAVHPYQDLVQLSVLGDSGQQLPHTRYRITENETGKPFRVRFENGQGVLYSLKSLQLGRIHRVAVLALSYDESETNILYTTKFIIFIHLPDD